MSKWIDYDAIDYKHYQLHDKSEEFLNGVVYMAERIEEAPSIEIVRCKECKWAKALGTYQWCSRLDSTAQITADDFCSYGEREGE